MKKDKVNPFPAGHDVHELNTESHNGATEQVHADVEQEDEVAIAGSQPSATVDADQKKREEEMQKALADLKEQVLRAQAETENTRRRAREELQKSHKFAIEQFAEHLLPVVDSLEAALADSGEDVSKMRDGVDLTLRQLRSALEKGRVTCIDPVSGEVFDPHRHQVIATLPAEQAANTIVAVLQKGYLVSDRVLRPALVTICQS